LNGACSQASLLQFFQGKSFINTKTLETGFINSLVPLLLVVLANTAAIADQQAYEECLLREIGNASNDVRMEDIKAACTAEKSDTVEPVSNELLLDEQDNQSKGAVEKRIERENQTELRPWVLTPHKPNFFLPINYNADPHDELYSSLPGADNVALDNAEIKFQISLKVPLAIGLFDDRAKLFAAYTNTSWWQAYNSDASSPFRETNHEPELFMTFENDWKILGLNNRFNTLGMVHQSNGRNDPLSRSWNRIYASMVFEKGRLGMGLKAWYRIEEDEAKDNNPDITDYLGYGEARFAYKKAKQTFSMMLRKKAVELTWSRYVWGNTRLYAQYFNGYGESLIYYDRKSEVLGIGIALTDWL
jgi:phospholipase A1